MQEKLLLNQARYADSDMSNITFPVNITGDKDVIVEDGFNEIVNQYNVYLDEREGCNTIRLTAKVNLMASNTIFNSVTEIVKNEGSPDCECININPRTVEGTIGKNENYKWGGERIYDAVMDTQLSSESNEHKNYTYLCGIDIFNNHILRSKSMNTSYLSFDNKPDYNTIKEEMCDIFGGKIRKYDSIFRPEFGAAYMRRYTKNNIYNFFDSLNNNLIEENGWLGFLNKSLMRPTSKYDDYVDGKLYMGYGGTERVINNIRANRFIDLFPDRTRYSIMPHYNQYRDRYEKNWEYCLTYPYSSTTNNIPFINQYLDTLKVAFIDENNYDDDGVYRCTVYSVSKHGLNPDDTINLYRSKMDDDSVYEQIEGELIVDEVIDDYIFTVYTSDWVCRKWLSVFDRSEDYNVKHIAGNVYSVGGIQEISVSEYLNIDYDSDNYIGSKNLSFAKVVNGVQCRYYVRIFSRFPNFDFYDKEITEENIYPNIPEQARPVYIYADKQYEKQSTQTKLGFSRNIYGDSISQIVYNDDINIDVLKDNLGRPLTSLYLTFFKTNYGYIEWYKKDGDVQKDSIEWSRCFGKLNCGFELCPYIDSDIYSVPANVHYMNNVNRKLGLYEKWFWEGIDANDVDVNGDDAILYSNQRKFYGDLCVYSPVECLETSIQDCCHRFNTAQRELSGYEYPSSGFTSVKYENIEDDEFTSLEDIFYTATLTYDYNPTAKPEGCYYHPNYEIPIRTFSTNVYEFMPELLDIVGFEKVAGQTNVFKVITNAETYFDIGTEVGIYQKSQDKVYDCHINNVLDLNILLVSVEGINEDYIDIKDIKIFKKNLNVPSYAEMIENNSAAYRWRSVVQNGFEEVDGIIKEYPFVNGCLYVNKDINIYLRRQDPFGDYGLASQAVYFGLQQVVGERNPVENGTAVNANDAISENQSRC